LNDVELLFCTHPIPDELLAQFERVADFRVDNRAPQLRELQAIARPELATAKARWTPHYDAALRDIVERGDKLIAEAAWDYATEEPYEHHEATKVREKLRVHARLVEQFVDAQARGARMLSDAYELCTIGTNELADWLALAPDQDALLARARDACIAYLRAGPLSDVERWLIEASEERSPELAYFKDLWSNDSLTRDRRMAMWVVVAGSPERAWLDMCDVPLDVIERLGNPFLPSTRVG